MVYKLNLIDKQGNRLSASVKAESLEEAHQKAVARGYTIEPEKEKDTDLVETMVISKEVVAKAKKEAELKNEPKKGDEDETTTDKPVPKHRSRGDRSQDDETDNDNPSRARNRRRSSYKPNKPKSNSNTLFTLLAFSPIIWFVAWLTFPYQLLLLAIQFPILIMMGPFLVVVGIIFSILLLVRSIKSKNSMLIITGSIATLLNIIILGFIIHNLNNRKGSQMVIYQPKTKHEYHMF